MKKILISIKPEWVCKILNGEKTIEVRKTAPKCELPIDVYIYCTEPNAKETLSLFAKEAREHLGRAVEFIDRKRVDNPNMRWSICNGKVVAKFTLMEVEKLTKRKIWGEWEAYGEHTDFIELDRKSCLTQDQIIDYMGRNYHAYAWHIKDLFIFDEPKKLNGKAPQSWQYIEVE